MGKKKQKKNNRPNKKARSLNMPIAIAVAVGIIIAVALFLLAQKAPSDAPIEETAPVSTALPEKITGVTAEVRDGGVTLSWDEAENADGYCIFRLKSGEYSTYKFSETPSKTFSGLTNGTEYIFAVAAYVIEDDREIYGERSDDISVIPENNTLKISDTFITLDSGGEYKLSCLLYDKEQEMIWLSSDSNVATVDENGLVRAVSEGTAMILATKDDESLMCSVAVDRKAPSPAVDTASRFARGSDGVYSDGKSGSEATIMFTGDLMAMRRQMRAAKKDDGSYDFSPSFSRVKHIFASADLVVGNLETTLSESFPYSIDLSKYMGVSNCNTVSSYLDALKTAGFDLLVTANNHYCDSGPRGLVETLDHLDEYNFMHIGTYRDASEPRVVVADVNGIRVGFLNYNQKSANGKDSMFTNEQQQDMLGKFFRSRVPRDVSSAKKLGAEFIIVCIHYGTQNSVTVSETQESINQYLADCGVDLIVGSHPHLLQKVSHVKASDNRKVPVAFSLGNFCSDMEELALNKYNIILNLTLKRNGKRIEISDLSYTPCCILKDTPRGKYVITPTAEKNGLSDDNLSELTVAEAEIKKIIGDEISPH